MQEYNLLIDKLLKQIDNKRQKSIFITGYIPLGKISGTAITKDLIAKTINSKLKKTIEKSKYSKDLSSISRTIFNSTEEEVKNQDKFKLNAALFIQINNLKELSKPATKKLPEEDITLVYTDVPLEEELFIGENYDLDQLLWINNLSAKSIVLTINQQKATIYSLTEHSIKELFEIQNSHINQLDAGDKEYIEKHNPTPQDQAVYGSGGKSVENTKIHANQLFINDIIDQIDSKINGDKKIYEFLVIFYSQKFSSLVDELTDSGVIKSNFTPLKIAQNIDSAQSELKEKAIKNIRAFQKTTKKNLFKEAKEQANQFVSGWKQVAEASRERKIEKMFIKPKTKKSGYLYKDEFVYTNKKVDTKRVKNISPWIVNSVIESGGKVIIMNKVSMDKYSPVAAKLRY